MPPWLRFWLGSGPEWMSVLLVFLTLAIAVRSVEQAQWIIPQPSLTMVLGLAVLAGWLLVKSRLPDAITFSIMIVLGVVITMWQTASLVPPPHTVPGSNHLLSILKSWWQAISLTKPSEGTIHFAVFLVFLDWIVGLISTWFILRKQNAWMTVFLGATILLVNLANLSEQYYYFFLIYFLASMLSIGLTNLSREYSQFQKYGSIYPKHGMVYFTASVIIISLLTIPGAWFTPEIQVKPLETVTEGAIPWAKSAETYWLNLFAAVPGKWDIIRGRDQKKLTFSDNINYSNEIQFIITAERPSYWRTRRYDTYYSWGWTSNTVANHLLKPETPITETRASPKRQEMTYTVETKLKTDVLLTAGEFVSTNIPVLLETVAATPGASQSAFPADNSPSTNETLPADSGQVLPPVNTLPELNNKTKEPLASASPDRVTDGAVSTEQNNKITTDGKGEVHGNAGDIVAIIAPQLLKPNQRYILTTSTLNATPDELSQAGENYAPRIIDYYLQLPDSLPERVTQFTKELTQGAKTAYDKAIIIKRFLNRFKYNEAVKPAPAGADPVDYFIFKQQEGDCVNFASTMAVMLRSVGVPTRLNTGYLHGKLDKDTGTLIVRARDYHAWPEAYFPGYGWVEFEATTRLENRINADEEINADPRISIFDFREEDAPSGPSGAASGDSSFSRQLGQSSPFPIISIQILAILAVVILLYRSIQRFTGADNAFNVYARMSWLASLVKSGPDPHETPLEYRTRLTAVIPAQAQAIDDIAQAYIQSRFSPRKTLFLLQEIKLQQSWRDVYRALLKRLLHLG
ncbi:MAG: transglutaminase domain-containing protein [Chloroflexi bacterium]|nr:transglutaminase domain-containing protein [Chloroflexota bacterium]